MPELFGLPVNCLSLHTQKWLQEKKEKGEVFISQDGEKLGILRENRVWFYGQTYEYGMLIVEKEGLKKW